MKRLIFFASIALVILTAGLTANAGTRFLKITLKSGDEQIIRLSGGVAVTFTDDEHTYFRNLDGEYIAENSNIIKVEHLLEYESSVSTIPAPDVSITLDGSTLHLSGITEATLYTTDGKPVATVTGGSIDMSDLPHSVYILATPLGSYKIKW